MSKLNKMIVWLVLAILMVGCTAPVIDQLHPAQIARYPAPDNYSQMNIYTELPVYDPTSMDSFQMDLRSANLEKLDLSGSKTDLLYAMYDSKTIWPAPDHMPADFDWQKIMEIGKDPGLGVRRLHDQGITGKGVNIAIIDQPLIIDHVEYPDKIRLYEEIKIFPATPSQMHGPAVASIAVGKTVGVAPDANLYYVATWLFDPLDQSRSLTYEYYAQAIYRVLEINKSLPADQKIRAISMSIGLDSTRAAYDDFMSAMEQAKAEGIFAITVDLQQTHGWNIMGLGRDSLADPNDFQSYEPAEWWQQQFFQRGLPDDTLLIPMDSRTTASPTDKEDYVFYRQGGMSWTVPYLAAVYALAVQVRPDITPEAFWEAAINTGRVIQLQQDGKDYEFGVILDPPALIEAIQTK